MVGDAEDEAVVLAAAVFSGSDAHALLGGLAGERAGRCRDRLEQLNRGTRAARRRRLAEALRRLFALPPDEFVRAEPERLAARLSPEPPAIRAVALADLPVPLAAKVAERIGHEPSQPAAPAPPLHTWLRRWLAGGLGE